MIPGPVRMATRERYYGDVVAVLASDNAEVVGDGSKSPADRV